MQSLQRTADLELRAGPTPHCTLASNLLLSHVSAAFQHDGWLQLSWAFGGVIKAVSRAPAHALAMGKTFPRDVLLGENNTTWPVVCPWPKPKTGAYPFPGDITQFTTQNRRVAVDDQRENVEYGAHCVVPYRFPLSTLALAPLGVDNAQAMLQALVLEGALGCMARSPLRQDVPDNALMKYGERWLA